MIGIKSNRSRNTNTVLVLAAIMLTMLFFSMAKMPPTEEQTRETHQKIMKTMEPEEPADDSSFDGWPRLGPILRILFYGVIAGVVIFLVIMIIRFLRRDTLKKPKAPLPPESPLPQANEQSSSTEWFSLACSFGEKENFSNAIICLHRGTIAMIQEQELIPDPTGKTNSELKRHLSDHKWQTPFTQLARLAERILFAHIPGTGEEWEDSKELYSTAFGGGE